ncbi:MAG: 16S rRNA (cytidine(1402)-2'-O)-methyltransferase [Parachlamydiaceae bacterium]
MLYLVATPIGNLTDITFRAVELLKNCDYILCEDTRHSGILLNHYGIHQPLKSFHKFNETFRTDSVLEDLRLGKVICLISDAGTPGICDPGSALVKICVEHNIPVSAAPGPCAAIHALICSGLETERFQFYGFLGRKESELKKDIQSILHYCGTTICYESPHRLLNTLDVINKMQPERLLVIGRELTKKFEEIVRGKALTLIEHWQNHPLKGELVLLVSPPSSDEHQDWASWTPEEHVESVTETYGLTRKEAIKLVAELRGVPKREIYQQLIQ